MNRETKFGLITGLLLIVAIGMLVSRYLSAGATPAIKTPHFNNLGARYRRQITAPAGTAVIPPALASHRHNGNIDTTAQPLAEVMPSAPPARKNMIASATPPANTTGNGHADGRGNQVWAPIPTTGNPRVVTNVSEPVARGAGGSSSRQYTVKPGDTLWHIALRFYHRAGESEMARIIRANPQVLSSTKSTLRVGEVLSIPAGDAAGNIHLTQMAAISISGVPIPTAAFTNPSTGRSAGNNAGSQATIITLKVRPGDTLYSIAHRVLGTGSHAAIRQIMRENHIHSARDLRIGQTLRIRKHG